MKMTTESGFRVVAITQFEFDAIQIEIATPDDKIEIVIIEINTPPPNSTPKKDRKEYLVNVLEAVNLALQKLCASNLEN